MTPPPPSSATAPAAVTGLPAPAPGRRLATLRVVEARPGRRSGRWRRLPALLAAAMLVASLLAVVVGHAMLTTGQIRLSAEQGKLAAEQAVHRQQELAVARLETPSRIVSQAEQDLHLVQPAQVDQLPATPLGVALAAPKLVPSSPVATTTSAPPTTTPPR